MGEKLVKYYDFARQSGGPATTMRLAMKTGVPSTKAADVPDSPENVQKFKDAIKELTGQEVPVI